jgi:hypothetical protein
LNHMLGMNPEEVRSKANLLRSQLSILESAAQTVEYAANSSLNPLSYGIQPGGLIIAPFAIAGTQRASARVRAACASVLELAAKLFDEADQQAIVSSGTSASYLGGYVPSVKNPRRPGNVGDPGDILRDILDDLSGLIDWANGGIFFEGFISTAGDAFDRWWKNMPPLAQGIVEYGAKYGKFVPFVGERLAWVSVATEWDDDDAWGNTRNIIGATIATVELVCLIPPLTPAAPIVGALGLLWDTFDAVWDLGDEYWW